MPDPLTPTDLAAIRARAGWRVNAIDRQTMHAPNPDVPTLLAEVDRLNGSVRLTVEQHRRVLAERDEARARLDAVLALCDEWEAHQAANRASLERGEFTLHDLPQPADVRKAARGENAE